MTEVQSGPEAVVAFVTEPDRDGDTLRYRGVDIEEPVGRVPFEQVRGLLVDGALERRLLRTTARYVGPKLPPLRV